MIDTPEITQTAEQIAAVIHLTIPRAQIQEVMGPGIEELMATVTAQGVKTTGPWFSHHLKMDPDTFDFEIGVPVETPVAPEGRVMPGNLPAVTVARTVYHGPYEGLSDGWGELMAWIETEKHTPADDLWECYTTGPESSEDPSTYRTELNTPLLGYGAMSDDA